MSKNKTIKIKLVKSGIGRMQNHKLCVKGLGFKKVSQQVINNAKILHWTGKKKPWLPNGRYKEIWNKYKL